MNATIQITGVIRAWLQGRSPHTARSYTATVMRFLTLTAKPLDQVTPEDVERFAASLVDLSPSSIAQRLAAVKSFLKFAHEMGAADEDAGRLARLPPKPDTLAERILSEKQVASLLTAPTDPVHRALLGLLYDVGLRVSEAVGLRWRDVSQHGEDVVLTIFGKGGKTRHVGLTREQWEPVSLLRGAAPAASRVFSLRTTDQAYRIVKRAARVAGLPEGVSPHWLRHAHATHAIDAGAPLHLVQRDLGHASLMTTERYLHARPEDSSARYLRKKL